MCVCVYIYIKMKKHVKTTVRYRAQRSSCAYYVCMRQYDQVVYLTYSICSPRIRTDCCEVYACSYYTLYYSIYTVGIPRV